MMEDLQIVELYWKRSEQAIFETEQKYGNYFRSISYRILKNREDANECVNDTWLCAWEHMPPQRPALFSAFLAKITRNLSLKRYEKESAVKRGGGQVAVVLDELEECVPAYGGVEQSVDLKQLTTLLNQFLGGLSEENRRLFMLRYWYLCPVRELAARSKMGQSKVKMRLMRMREALRDLLLKEGYRV